MSSFSLRHRLHLLFVLLYGCAFVMMCHDSECSLPLSRKFQMCVPSSVEFLPTKNSIYTYIHIDLTKNTLNFVVNVSI